MFYNAPDKIMKLISKLTRLKEDNLIVDDELLKELKSILKRSDDYIDIAFDQIYDELQSPNSCRRYGALVLCNQLFTRSKRFRELLTPKLQDFFMFTVELNPTTPLPKPKKAARKLHQETLECFEQWKNSYGSIYHSLQLGYQYLRGFDVQFPEIKAEKQFQQEQKRKEKSQQYLRVKYNRVKNEMNENYQDIVQNMQQVERCILLLVPEIGNVFEGLVSQSELHQPNHIPADHNNDIINSSMNSSMDDDDIQNNQLNYNNNNNNNNNHFNENIINDDYNDDDDDDEWDIVASKESKNQEGQNDQINNNDDEDYFYEYEDDQGQIYYERVEEWESAAAEMEHMVQNFGFEKELTIDVSSKMWSIEKNDSNRDIFDSLHDSLKELTHIHIPRLVEWKNILSKVDPSNLNEHKQLWNRIIDLREVVVSIFKKCKSLNVKIPSSKRKIVSPIKPVKKRRLT